MKLFGLFATVVFVIYFISSTFSSTTISRLYRVLLPPKNILTASDIAPTSPIEIRARKSTKTKENPPPSTQYEEPRSYSDTSRAPRQGHLLYEVSLTSPRIAIHGEGGNKGFVFLRLTCMRMRTWDLEA